LVQETHPICIDESNAPVITPCRHSFCEGCIKQALKRLKECPTCRRPVTTHRELRADPQHTKTSPEHTHTSQLAALLSVGRKRCSPGG